MTSGRRLRGLVSLLAVTVAIAAGAAHAEDTAWTLERVIAAVGKSAVKAVPFREERYLRITTKPVVLEGILKYEDGRLEKITRAPKAERIVIEGDRIRIIEPDKNIDRTAYLVDFPALDALVSGLRAILSGDLDALKQQFWIRYTATDRDWRIVLQPLADTVSDEVQSVVMTGTGGRLSAVELNEDSGDRTVIRILDH